MKFKKESIIYTIVIVLLLISIALVVLNITQGKAKEYVEAKKIMELLKDNNAIDNNFDVLNSEYEVLKENEKEKGYIRYTIMTSDYGIDLSEDYRIVGFQNKKVNSSNGIISEEEAKQLAIKYIALLTDDDLTFKEVKTNTNDNDTVYTIGFAKTYDKYEIFGQEAIVKVNKTTGFLEGYNNLTVKNIKYDSDIKIDKEKAMEIAIIYFGKMDVKIEKLEEPKLIYFLQGNDKGKLTYLFETEIVDNENVAHKYKLFISTKTGEVINAIDDTINKPKAQ